MFENARKKTRQNANDSTKNDSSIWFHYEMWSFSRSSGNPFVKHLIQIGRNCSRNHNSIALNTNNKETRLIMPSTNDINNFHVIYRLRREWTENERNFIGSQKCARKMNDRKDFAFFLFFSHCARLLSCCLVRDNNKKNNDNRLSYFIQFSPN